MESGCSCILIPSGSVVLLQNTMLTKKKTNANTEQVVSSVINSVHTEVNGCHYFVIIKVSQPNQQASNSTSRLEIREARS